MTFTLVDPSNSPEVRMSMITVTVNSVSVLNENWAISVMSTGPPGTATTASNESDGSMPPWAVATTTACPRLTPLTVPLPETEATEAFRLKYVTVGLGMVLPLSSFTVTIVPAAEPGSTISGFGVRVSRVGPGGPMNVAVTARSAVMLRTQVPVPVHAPLQPLKEAPATGAAVRVTDVPLM